MGPKVRPEVVCLFNGCTSKFVTMGRLRGHLIGAHSCTPAEAEDMAQSRFAKATAAGSLPPPVEPQSVEDGAALELGPADPLGAGDRNVADLASSYFAGVRQELALSRLLIGALMGEIEKLECERKPLRGAYIEARAKLNQLEKDRSALEAEAQAQAAAV